MGRQDKLITRIESICNAAELAGIFLVLMVALVLQMFFHEVPCTLCLLQRVGFIGIALGFLMNLRFGFYPSHYALVILSALFTSFVALRQIALHVVPGTGSYGDPVFGLHLYTWSFIIAMLVLVGTTLMMSVDRQYAIMQTKTESFKYIINLLFGYAVLLVGSNLMAVIF